MWSALHEDGKIAHSTPLLVGGFQFSLGIYYNLGKEIVSISIYISG